MSLYLLFMISPILVSPVLLLKGNKDKKLNYYLIIMGILFFTFFAFRSKNLGSTDSQFYYTLWEKLSDISINELSIMFDIDMEKGFLFFVWALSHVFKNGQFIFITASAIFTISVILFLKDNCDNYVAGFMIINAFGITSFFLQGLRQSIAICICLLATKFCKERRLWHFIFLVILASTIHGSALVFLVAYFIYGKKLNFKSIIVILGLSIVSPFIVNSITKLANIIMNETYRGSNTELTSGGTMTLLVYVALIIYSFVFHKTKGTSKKDITEIKDFSFSFFMYLIAVAFFMMRFFYITVFERASYYFLFFMIPMLKYTKNKFNKKSQIFLTIGFIFMLLLLALYKASPSSPLYNYRLFWK